jgi:hypothetical protein
MYFSSRFERSHFSGSQGAKPESRPRVNFAFDTVAKLRKCRATNFPRKDKQATIADQCSLNPVTEIACELAHGGVVPHIIVRSSRLRFGKFATHAAKRLLQQYPPTSERRQPGYVR